MNKKELCEKAVTAKEKALPTYSHFHVGAALLTKDNKLYIGGNIESSSYGLTICAERTALFTALLDGAREFEAIAIAGGDGDDYCPPCGACRQVLMDYCGGDLKVYLTNNSNEIKEFKLKELIPYSFGEENLK